MIKNTEINLPVLVIDDEEDLCELIEVTLIKMGLKVITAGSVANAIDLLSKKKFALVLTDMRLPDGLGLEIVQYIQQKELDIPSSVITAHGSAENAVDAMKAGAFDYLQKPISLNQLRTLVKSALKINSTDNSIKNNLAQKNIEEFSEVSAQNKLLEISKPLLIGEAPAMCEARKLISKLAKTQTSVYILGESGTGKELAARSIHDLGARADKAFVPVNCGAIPENLVESEFFGYRKGAFTGADRDHQGFFQQANGGTLFLDEVADLPLSMQVKLLRAIQEKKIRRIGSSKEEIVDVRLLCATHKNLYDEVAEGRFRQDLYFRLNVISLKMPPLRELREDIPFLIDMLLRKFSDTELAPKLDAASKKLLMSYSYSGNFRELENILERAVALCSNNLIVVDDLQLLANPAQVLDLEANTEMAIDNFETLPDFLDRVERDAISKALEGTRFNRTQAAKVLGISFRSLRYRLERLGIE